MLLHARTSCPAPLVYFGEEAGALTLGAREKDFGAKRPGAEAVWPVRESASGIPSSTI